MLNNAHISRSGHSLQAAEITEHILFAIVFVVLGCFRIVRALVSYLLVLSFRVSLAILVYTTLGLIIISAFIVILSYYLVALPGNQLRIP